MSQQLISRSPDLQQLRDDGYDVDIKAGCLLIKNVPYVNSNKEIKLGILVSKLELAGDIATGPNDHVAYFVGDHPCNKDGSEIVKIKHQSAEQQFDSDLVVQHSFSSKPTSGSYKNYHDKMATYVAIICSPAQSIDSNVTAKIFPVILPNADQNSVFNYVDTASGRAGINLIGKKLELGKVAIVGLGGTGSYVLDFVAKTLVKEIHLFDGDVFLQHNGFRSPGAPSIETLRLKLPKVIYFQQLYSPMRQNIFAHNTYIDETNVDQLHEMDFTFLCLDSGKAKRLIVEKLEEFGDSFIDVGMGIHEVDGSLGGILRVTTSTVNKRDHVRNRISFSDGDANNEYSRNIQVADLNSLNAALAVVKWKKLFGYYQDLENEHNTTYTIDGNSISNDEKP